jgi:hypothetical protein
VCDDAKFQNAVYENLRNKKKISEYLFGLIKT